MKGLWSSPKVKRQKSDWTSPWTRPFSPSSGAGTLGSWKALPAPLPLSVPITLPVRFWIPYGVSQELHLALLWTKGVMGSLHTLHSPPKNAVIMCDSSNNVLKYTSRNYYHPNFSEGTGCPRLHSAYQAVGILSATPESMPCTIWPSFSQSLFHRDIKRSFNSSTASQRRGVWGNFNAKRGSEQHLPHEVYS